MYIYIYKTYTEHVKLILIKTYFFSLGETRARAHADIHTYIQTHPSIHTYIHANMTRTDV